MRDDGLPKVARTVRRRISDRRRLYVELPERQSSQILERPARPGARRQVISDRRVAELVRREPVIEQEWWQFHKTDAPPVAVAGCQTDSHGPLVAAPTQGRWRSP